MTWLFGGDLVSELMFEFLKLSSHFRVGGFDERDVDANFGRQRSVFGFLNCKALDKGVLFVPTKYWVHI